MQYFIGIVPPEDYFNRIVDFQSIWSNNGIVNSVEPHITVKMPNGLTHDKKWINEVEKVCENFSGFNIQIGEPNFYGTRVLHLTVISNELHKLHEKIVNVINPPRDSIKENYEMDGYTPHISLGITDFGISYEELLEMQKQARIELYPYPKFKAESIRIYEQKDQNSKYIGIKDIYLGKERNNERFINV